MPPPNWGESEKKRKINSYNKKNKHKAKKNKYFNMQEEYEEFQHDIVNVGSIGENSIKENSNVVENGAISFHLLSFLKQQKMQRKKKLNVVEDDNVNNNESNNNDVPIANLNSNNLSIPVLTNIKQSTMRQKTMRLNIVLNQHKAALKEYKANLKTFINVSPNDEITKDALVIQNKPLLLKRLKSAPMLHQRKEEKCNSLDSTMTEGGPKAPEWDEGKEYCEKVHIIGGIKSYVINVKSNTSFAAISLVISKSFTMSNRYIKFKILPLIGIDNLACLDIIYDELKDVKSISDLIGPRRKYSLRDILDNAVTTVKVPIFTMNHVRTALNNIGCVTRSDSTFDIWNTMVNNCTGGNKTSLTQDPMLGKMVCNICFSLNESPRHGAALPGCEDHKKHWFCNNCWKEYLENASKNPSFNFTCPKNDCLAKISCNALLTLVPNPKSCLRLINFKLEKFIQQDFSEIVIDDDINVDFEASTKTKTCWCPNSKCNRLLSLNVPLINTFDNALQKINACSNSNTHGSSMFVCDCGETVCSKCGKEGHFGVSCDIYRKFKLVSNGMDEEALSDLFIKKHSRPCSKCSFRIIRYTGCNHVRCGKCQFYMCYACGGPGNDCNAYQCKNGSRMEKKHKIVKQKAMRVSFDITMSHKAGRVAFAAAKNYAQHLYFNYQLYTPDERSIFAKLIQTKHMVYLLQLRKWANLCRLLPIRLKPNFHTCLLQAEVTAHYLQEKIMLIQTRAALRNKTINNKVLRKRRITKRKRQSLLSRGIAHKEIKKEMKRRNYDDSIVVNSTTLSYVLSFLLVEPTSRLKYRSKKDNTRKNKRAKKTENLLLRRKKFSEKCYKYASPWQKGEKRMLLGSSDLRWKGKVKAKILRRITIARERERER